MTKLDPAKPLKEFKPNHKFFVGIDSDGCVFDTMGIKQRECFCPWMIAYFGLQPVAEAARECKDFADLFSKTRGANRHKTIERILTDLLPTHPMVKARNFEVPQFPHYFAWINDAKSILSNDGLQHAIENATEKAAKEQLQHALEWSKAVNKAVKDIVKHIPPFPHVRQSLEKIRTLADVVVISSTPYEALEREWAEHDVEKYTDIIAGQEMGKKKDHIAFAASGKYEPENIIMIGDAPGDMQAAKANNVLFYPINPGNEDASWQRFHDEAFDKFINGQYAGEYEEKVIAEFNEYLPQLPSWQK